MSRNFASDVLSHADPNPVGDLLTRHDALLQRVTVLERALEKIHIKTEEETPRKRDADACLRRIGVIAERALDG